MKQRETLALIATTSHATNVLLQVICDERSGLRLIADAAELISLIARTNALIADEKRHGSSYSDEFSAKPSEAHKTTSEAILRGLAGRER